MQYCEKFVRTSVSAKSAAVRKTGSLVLCKSPHRPASFAETTSHLPKQGARGCAPLYALVLTIITLVGIASAVLPNAELDKPCDEAGDMGCNDHGGHRATLA